MSARIMWTPPTAHCPDCDTPSPVPHWDREGDAYRCPHCSALVDRDNLDVTAW